MKYLDEYRSAEAARALASAIRSATTQSWTLMEVCGGQTHTILKSGLEELLPPEIRSGSRTGLPVCVTPIELIDKAIALADGAK